MKEKHIVLHCPLQRVERAFEQLAGLRQDTRSNVVFRQLRGDIFGFRRIVKQIEIM